jgi:hypothetical protein
MPEAQKLKRATIQLPTDVHTKIKVFCAERRVPMIEWLAALAGDAINAAKKKEAK